MKQRNLIADAFFEGVAAFSERSGAVNFVSRAEYSGAGKKRALKKMFCTASYENYDIEYTYTVSLLNAYSLFGFRIIFRKSVPYVKFSPYDLMYIVDEDDYRCYYYSFIENPGRMRAVVDGVAPLIEELFPKLDRLAHNRAALDNVCDKFTDGVNAFYGRSIFRLPESEDDRNISVLQSYYDSDNYFYASKPYGQFLIGDYNRSYNGIRKQRYKSYYQIRLMSFMASLDERYEAVPRDINTTGDAVSADRTQNLRFFASALIMYFPCMLFFAALHYLTAALIYRGALWANAYLFLNVIPYISAAVIPAFALSVYARRLTLLPFGKERRRYLSDLDSICLRRGMGCVGFLAALVTMFAVLFIIENANSYAAFYEDGVRLPSESVFSSDNYAYADVEKLICAEGVYDINGNFVKSERYYLALGSGKKYALSDEAPAETIRNRIIPILEKAGVPVKTVRDASDLDFEFTPAGADGAE